MAAAALMQMQDQVKFEDVFVYFSQEEWALLEETQRLLYHDVMLENFALIASLGCWHGVKDGETASKKRALVCVSKSGTPIGNHSTQNVHSYKTYDPVLKEILHLTGHQDTHPRQRQRQKPYTHVTSGKQLRFSTNLPHPQEQQDKEKSFEKEEVRHYKCSDCGKTFGRKDSLVQHQRAHTGERPYECGKCGKSFSRKTILAQHQRIHTEEMPYECDMCGKVFNYSSNFIVHQRVHTGARPYKCTECGKAYSHKSTLVEHESVHTGERPYKCNNCEKAFRQRSSLIQHCKVHTEERP